MGNRNGFCGYKQDKEQSDSLPGIGQVLPSFKFEDFDLTEGDRTSFENLVDVLFVVDQISLMDIYIDDVISVISNIVKQFNEKDYNLKYSFCKYHDHSPDNNSFFLTEFEDYCSANIIVEKINQLYFRGCQYESEAVMDGLRDGLTQNTWRTTKQNMSSQRFLFHVCYGPPHGEEYGGQSAVESWSKEGCPCGTKKEDIRDLLIAKDIKYFLIKKSDEIPQMESIFRESFSKNFKQTLNIPIDYPNLYKKELICCEEDN